MSQSDSVLETSLNKKNTDRWTQKETLCFLKLFVKNKIFQIINGPKVHRDFFKEFEAPMRENGFNKTGRQIRIKFKRLQEEHHKTRRNKIPTKIGRKIAYYMKQLHYLFNSGPKNTADSYGGSVIDPEEQNEPIVIMENSFANEMKNSETTGQGEQLLEVEPLKELENNQKQNINKDQSIYVKMLDQQSKCLKDVINEILERQEGFMTRVMNDQMQVFFEMQAKYHEIQITQSKILMDGFRSELKHMMEDSKK